MRKTLLVMRSEIRSSFQRKTFVLFAFGLPIALGVVALAFMLINRDGGAEQAKTPQTTAAVTSRQGYVDESGLIQQLPAGVTADQLAEFPDRAAAQAALVAGQIAGYYVVPSRQAYLEDGRVDYVTRDYNPIFGDLNASGMEWALLVTLLEGDTRLAQQVLQPLDVEVTRLAPPEAAEAEDNWIVELFPVLMVLILYMVILIPAGSLVNAVTDEKKNRVLEVLMTSVSTEQLIAGKILALGLLGLLSAAAWVGVLWAVATFGGQSLQIPPGFEVPTTIIFWTFIYFLGGYAIYGAQMAGLGALVKDYKESRTASLIIMSPMILAYVFNMVIVENPDGPLAVLLSLFPLTSPVAMISRMAATAVPVWQLVLAAVLQFGTAVVIVRLTARLFRAQAMLSGQPFSVQLYYKMLLGRA